MKSKTAADIMTRNPCTVSADMLLTDALATMLEHGVGCLPVVDDAGTLQGIVTEYDLMNFTLSGEADRTRVGESMTSPVKAFAPDANLETIANTCVAKRLHRVPVVDQGKLVGIISRSDILREMLAIYQDE